MGIWPIVGRRRRRLEAAEAEARKRAEERELSPREKLARDGGMASFGLNLPWWTRAHPGRQRASGRRRG